jgi:hypothetical protein
MYWPCGVPQVYAYNGTKTLETKLKEDNEHDKPIQSGDEVNEESTEAGETRAVRTEGGHDNSISDLRVARLDHIFVTISASCLTIWSNRVGCSVPFGTLC